MATPVVFVDTGGLAVTLVNSQGIPVTPVTALGHAVTVISANGLPVSLIGSDGLSLLSSATSYLGGIAPDHYWDFTQNRALFSGVDVGPVASTPGWSLTRATVGTAETLAGEIVQFGSGELRRTDRGVLIEGARTNLFLNSATGATQNVTVTAVAHTLSFRGTGTITLSGASTAGPLVGTGVNDRVTLTFTPSAATLTLTVSGSCTNVQLEEGAFASSWIPTAGASVTRDADVLTVSSPGIAFPTSMWAEAVRAVDTAGIELSLRADNGGATELITLSVSNTTDLAQATMTAGGVSQANPQVAGATSVGVTYKVAGAYETNRVQACRSGILATVDTVATVPSAPTVLRFGSNSSGAGQPFGYIRRAAVFNSALSDANLQTITT